MIRRLIASDIPAAAQLWLQTSLEAHPFIAASYWQDNLDRVRGLLAKDAETYVFVNRHKICGFISLLADNFIGALFVAKPFQRNRIGAKLLDYALRRRPVASLCVYAANRPAISFYHHRGFKIIREQIEPETGVAELVLAWAKGCKSGPCRRPGES